MSNPRTFLVTALTLFDTMTAATIHIGPAINKLRKMKLLIITLFFATTVGSLAAAEELMPSQIVAKLLSISGGAEKAVLHGHTEKGEACDLVAFTDDNSSQFWIRPTDPSDTCADVNSPKSHCRMSGIPDRFDVHNDTDRWYFSLQPLFPDRGNGLYIRKSMYDIPLAVTFPAFDDVPEYTCHFETQNI